MAKNKKNLEDIDLRDEAPKKGFLKKLFSGKAETKKILSNLKTNGNKSFLFYTDVNNILLILEHGVRLLKEQKLRSGEEYSVWTYLENEGSIGLELDSSTRAHFWKWASDAKIDIEKVAVIGIDPKKLADACKNDWALDKVTNIVYVYETIPRNAISWIMIKDKANLKRVQTYVEANDIEIDVFFGEKGNIDKIDKGEK